ncbi:MAG: biotin--[acetyl-CoA-carboxylase] ligase [Lachnospiraceae bacterium]|nr:biotin--[acetyl-CoA-carboxylase] ligase [Lachnospiraceae bacterium]
MYDQELINKSVNIYTEILETVDSTNEEAKRRVSKGAKEDFVLISKKQTAGKGRKGREFYSPKDTGIYLTYSHFSELAAEDDLKVTVASAVIVKRAIQAALGLECGIKWVNDLYYNKKKVCGILCECLLKGTYGNDSNVIIVGIGINLSTQIFPEDIKDKAGSLMAGWDTNNDDMNSERMSKKQIEYDESLNTDIYDDLAVGIINGLSCFFENNELEPYMEEYKNSSIVLGNNAELYDAKGPVAKGRVKDFDSNGALILENKDGDSLRFDSGEISLIFN